MLRLGEKLDKFYLFGEKDSSLEVLNTHYSIPYKIYTNKFTGIDKNLYLMPYKSKQMYLRIIYDINVFSGLKFPTDDTTEKGVRKHNALPFSKEGNVSSAPQVFRVAANSYSEQTRSSQRKFRYYFNKWNNTHGGLHTFKPTIYIASGGFTPKTTYPVGTSASHKRTIYVLRHIIR